MPKKRIMIQKKQYISENRNKKSIEKIHFPETIVYEFYARKKYDPEICFKNFSFDELCVTLKFDFTNFFIFKVYFIRQTFSKRNAGSYKYYKNNSFLLSNHVYH